MRSWAAALMASLLAACAAPVPDATGPRDGVARLENDAFVTRDGARLPLRPTLPDAAPAQVLVAVHGMNDYGNFIADAARFWASEGVATYAYDQRGFGAAPGVGRWYGGPAMGADLGELVAAVQARHPGVPVYVLGESMGGAVTLLAGLDGQLPGVRGVILSAPAVWGRASMGLIPRVSLWAGARLFPDMRLTGQGLKITPSDNIEMLRALGRDPLVIKGTRIGTIYGLVGLMDAALARAGGGDLPTLFLYGTRDEIIPAAPTCTVLRQFRDRHTGPWRVALYDSGYHMLLRDLGAMMVWQDILSWLRTPDAPLPSGRDATAHPDRWPGCPS